MKGVREPTTKDATYRNADTHRFVLLKDDNKE